MRNTMEQQQQATDVSCGKSTRDRILEYIAANPGASLDRISAAVGRSRSAVFAQVQRLRRDGVLARARANERRAIRVTGGSGGPGMSDKDALHRRELQLSQAAHMCGRIVNRLGDVSSMAEVSKVYDRLLQLQELLAE